MQEAKYKKGDLVKLARYFTDYESETPMDIEDIDDWTIELIKKKVALVITKKEANVGEVSIYRVKRKDGKILYAKRKTTTFQEDELEFFKITNWKQFMEIE